MKNQSYVSILAGLALTACLALAAAATFAQDNIQRGPVTIDPNLTYLKCAPAKSDVAALVTVTNNSGKVVPQGAKIFAQNQKGLKGNFTIGSGGLQPNANVTVNLGGSWTDSTPCSAYAKK